MKNIICTIVLSTLLGLFGGAVKAEEFLVVNKKFTIAKVNDTTVKFKGEFISNTGMLLLSTLTSYPIESIIIESNGGLMSEAIVLGKYLQVNDTQVIIEKDTMCVSACAFAVMAADQVQLDGQLVFHSPFYPMVPIDMTFYELSKNSSMMALEMSRWFIENGYSLSLLNAIYSSTNNQRYIAFDDISSLYSFKSENSLFAPDEFQNKFKILTDGDIGGP